MLQTSSPTENRISTIAERVALPLAMAVMTAVTISVVMRGSLSINGTRYFWLDDDQMVSMRYARNLAEGHGLVWNPGERVEGYTSLGWTLVMAAVHFLPLGDQTMSLAVKVISWLLACAVLLLTDRLLKAFVPAPGWTRVPVLLTVALSADLLFWSANGFETSLVTVIFLSATLWLVRDVDRSSPGLWPLIVASFLPVARSDGYHLLGALLMAAVALHRDWRRIPQFVAAASIVPAAQLLFRHAYYGEWLPNTYYLKVAGIPGLFWGGAGYLKSFGEAYSAPLALAVAGAWWAKDRRLRWLLGGVLISAAYVLRVGADNFPYFRFFASWVPLIVVLGTAAAWRLAGAAWQARAVMVVILALVTTIHTGVHGRHSLELLMSPNGSPVDGLIAAVAVRESTSADATIAVTAAGAIPYFSRRASLDLLGKTDAHIARLPPHMGAPIGHKRFDPEYTLARHPDLVVTLWPRTFGNDAESSAWVASAAGSDDYRVAITTSPAFIAEYVGQTVPLPYLLARCAIYVRRDSPEAARRAQWRMPAVEP